MAYLISISGYSRCFVAIQLKGQIACNITALFYSFFSGIYTESNGQQTAVKNAEDCGHYAGVYLYIDFDIVIHIIFLAQNYIRNDGHN
jgi:hypothetical protein